MTAWRAKRRSGWAGAACACLLLSGCGVVADSHNRQGVRSVYQGNYPAAMSSFQKALTRDSENADAYYNMAATLHRLGKQGSNPQYLRQAEELYNQCLDLNEDHAECHRGLAVLLAETKRSDRAFKLLRNWTLASPDNPDAHIELARLYEEFGQDTAAVQQLQDALRIDYQNHRALTALASLREQQGDSRQALENYQRAYALQPHPEVASRIAALNRSVAGGSGGLAPNSTRTVTSDRTPRY